MAARRLLCPSYIHNTAIRTNCKGLLAQFGDSLLLTLDLGPSRGDDAVPADRR